MNFKIVNFSTLGVFLFSVASTQAVAHDGAYWKEDGGEVAKSSFGECWRTFEWTAEQAIADCGDGAASTAQSDAAAKADAKARAKARADAARAKADADAAKARANAGAAQAEPQYRNLSLSSGATFALGGSTLSAAGKAAVAGLLAEFEGETIKSVVVEGHTDDRGAASFNQQLSEKRANAVKAELVANGVDAAVIKTVGYGEARPIADNSDRAGRAKNRRVEIKVDAKTRKL